MVVAVMVEQDTPLAAGSGGQRTLTKPSFFTGSLKLLLPHVRQPRPNFAKIGLVDNKIDITKHNLKQDS